MSRLEDVRLYPVYLPYVHPIHWRAHAEHGVDSLFVRLRTSDGLVGAAETPVRPGWHKTDLKTLVENVTQTCLPRLQDRDILDNSAIDVLRTSDVHPLARALMDCALHDLRSNARAASLRSEPGGVREQVQVSYTVTRQEPLLMARDAEQACARHGFDALKIKTGQGQTIDDQALQAIRSAVGDDVTFYADANNSHAREDLPAYREIYARGRVQVVEDPCPLKPDRALLRDIAGVLEKPILVDNACRSFETAMEFVDAGAQAISVKVMKTGLSDSIAILSTVRRCGVKASIGLSASSSLGALSTLSLAAQVATSELCAPCEETFFTLMPNVLRQPLVIREGVVAMPKSAGFHDLVDWSAVEALRSG